MVWPVALLGGRVCGGRKIIKFCEYGVVVTHDLPKVKLGVRFSLLALLDFVDFSVIIGLLTNHATKQSPSFAESDYGPVWGSGSGCHSSFSHSGRLVFHL